MHQHKYANFPVCQVLLVPYAMVRGEQDLVTDSFGFLQQVSVGKRFPAPLPSGIYLVTGK